MDESLMQRLTEKNEYFKRMANLIPPQFYFDKETKQVADGKYFKNKAEKAPNQKRKETSKKGANKLRRLDPSQHKTVTEIQKEMAEKEDNDSSSDEEDEDEGGDSEGAAESEDEGVHSGDDVEEEPMEVTEVAEPKTKRKKVKGQSLKPVSVEKVRTGASLDDLRDKLQQRIAELRLKRKAPSGMGDEAAPPRKLSKKMKEVERKKKEKMEAIQASKKKLQDSMRSKAKLKEAQENGTDESAPGKVVSQQEPIAFSKFKFEENDIAKALETRKKKKRRDEPRSGKDYVRLLAKAEKHKQDLTELKEKNPEKAQQVITKEKWQKALDKAQGVKIKDDPELLKKSMKRQLSKRKRSSKEWKSRTKLTEKLIKGKQDKRERNIQKRKDTKKSKKVKRLQKKGKLLLQDD